MMLDVLDKINSKLRLHHRQNKFLNKPIQRVLCHVMIERCFDSTCFMWYRSLQNDLQKRHQVSQNNFVSFCQQLEKKKLMGAAEFEETNWLNLNDAFS